MTAETWRRLHPLSPLLQGGLAFVIIIGIIFANLRDRLVWRFFPNELQDDEPPFFDLTEIWLYVLLGALGIVLLVALITWLSWFFNSYRITTEAVETRKGILFKQSRRAPLERIQSVNLQSPLLARVLGLTKIDIQTGGQSGNATLAYLSKADAQKVRDEILHLADTTATVSQAGTDQQIAADSQIPTAVVKVPIARLVGSTFLSNEAIIFIVLTAAIPIAAFFWGWGILAGLIPGLIALFSVSYTRFNKGFNFAISETTNGVKTGSGLTATSTETIPRHRIHAIDVLQPIGWRPFGWWRIRVTTAGTARSGSGNNQSMFQNILLPVGKQDQVQQVLEILIPGIKYDDRETAGYTRSPKRAFWVLLLARARASIKVIKNETQTLVQIKRGALTRHLILMPLKRAQSTLLARPALHFFLKLATLQIHTVMGPVSVTARGIDSRDAEKLFTEISETILTIGRNP